MIDKMLKRLLCYSANMESGDQVDGEEYISATIFERQEQLEEGEEFSRAACDQMAFDIICGIIARFPTGNEVQDDDFKRYKSEISSTIFERQGAGRGERVFNEEDCNELGRDILMNVLKTLRPDLVVDPEEDRPGFCVARMTRTLEKFEEQHGGDEPSELVPDLLADAMHYCDSQGIDFEESLETARRNYEGERVEPPRAMRV